MIRIGIVMGEFLNIDMREIDVHFFFADMHETMIQFYTLNHNISLMYDFISFRYQLLLAAIKQLEENISKYCINYVCN